MNCYARFSRRKKTILPAVCLGRNLSYLAFHSGCSFSSRSFHPIFGASRTVFFCSELGFHSSTSWQVYYLCCDPMVLYSGLSILWHFSRDSFFFLSIAPNHFFSSGTV